MLSGRGLCDELITRPEESYRLWYVVVYDLETSRIGAPYIYDISNLRVKARSRNRSYGGKAVSIASSEGVSVALVIQHAISMHSITRILSFVAYLSVPKYSALSHKWHIFRKKLLNTKVCFDFLYKFV